MPQDEETRIRRLRALGVLDTPPEQRFDRITRMAADIFKAPIALVSLVDVERQWFKSRVGLEAPETPRSLAFCAHAIEDGPNSVMVVENAAADPRFAGNPLVVDDPNIRFYAGATLTTSDGNKTGHDAGHTTVSKNRAYGNIINRVVGETGPDHEKIFEVEVSIGAEILARSTGRSKKEAEQAAAKDALQALSTRTVNPAPADGTA